MNNKIKYAIPLTLIPISILAQEFSQEAINKAIETFGEKQVQVALWSHQLKNGSETVRDSITNYLNNNLYVGSGAVYTVPQNGTKLSKWSDGTNVADIAMVGSGLGRFSDEYTRDASTTLPSTFNLLNWDDKQIAEFMFNNYGIHNGVDYTINRDDDGNVIYLKDKSGKSDATVRNRETLDGKILEAHRNWVPTRVKNDSSENYLSFPVNDGLRLAGTAVDNIVKFINNYDSLNTANKGLDDKNSELESELEGTRSRNQDLENQNESLTVANYQLNQDNNGLRKDLDKWSFGGGIGINSDGKAIYIAETKMPFLNGRLAIATSYQGISKDGETATPVETQSTTIPGVSSVSEMTRTGASAHQASIDVGYIIPVSETVKLTPMIGVGVYKFGNQDQLNSTYFKNASGDKFGENSNSTVIQNQYTAAFRLGAVVSLGPADLRFMYNPDTKKGEIGLSTKLIDLSK